MCAVVMELTPRAPGDSWLWDMAWASPPENKWSHVVLLELANQRWLMGRKRNTITVSLFSKCFLEYLAGEYPGILSCAGWD